METTIFFIVLFLSGVWADCGKNPALFITTPKEMTALNGSCLQIPCTFKPAEGNTLKNSRPFYGIWIKMNPRIAIQSNIVFNSSGAVRTYPMTIIGNMTQRNCSTLFSNLTTDYTKQYYFRVENEAFKATASCDPIQVHVQDSPWKPSIEISGKQTETELVTITCSAVTPCPHSPPQLTWDLHQGTPNIRETNSDGTFTTKIKLNITLTDSHDGLLIKCSAVYPVTGGVKMADSNISLNVTYAPKNTSVWVSPSGSLSAGQLVKLSCSSRAKPPVDHFTWIRHSSQGPVTVYEGDTYSFNFSKATQGQYYCKATNEVGKQTSAVIHLDTKGVPAGGFPHSAALAGGIVGIIVIIAVLLAIWQFKWRHKPSQQTQSLTAEATPIDTNNGDEVHYGQIDFSKLRQKPAGQSVRDKDQETVYAQVKVSHMAESSDIYAQVIKNKIDML